MTTGNPPFDYDENTPLRLDIAARIAFPDGTMGTPGLRKERDAGRLVTELIAGKEYVTLSAIQEMRHQCRGRRKGRGGEPPSIEGRSMALQAAFAACEQIRSSQKRRKGQEERKR